MNAFKGKVFFSLSASSGALTRAEASYRLQSKGVSTAHLTNLCSAHQSQSYLLGVRTFFMFRLITLLALLAIVFTASGLHKLGGEAHAAHVAHVVEQSHSVDSDCCAETTKKNHSTCIAPYIVASNNRHCLSNQQNTIFVFLDDNHSAGATASPLKRPPRLVL